jgi:hypothetical protein
MAPGEALNLSESHALPRRVSDDTQSSAPAVVVVRRSSASLRVVSDARRILRIKSPFSCPAANPLAGHQQEATRDAPSRRPHTTRHLQRRAESRLIWYRGPQGRLRRHQPSELDSVFPHIAKMAASDVAHVLWDPAWCSVCGAGPNRYCPHDPDPQQRPATLEVLKRPRRGSELLTAAPFEVRCRQSHLRCSGNRGGFSSNLDDEGGPPGPAL